jgi:hypothetical protein
MTQTTAELLLIVPTIFFLSVLMFLSGPLRSTMNKMDNAASKQFISLLFQLGQRSPFLLTITNLTVIGMIPYFIVYGFNNWWFIAGLTTLIISASIAKIIKLPIYKQITLLDADTPKWTEAKLSMHKANIFQAAFTFIAVCLMAIGIYS